MPKSKIGTVEAIMLIFGIIVVHTILSLPVSILTSYESASIINLIYVGILAILIAYLIYRLLKNFPGSDLLVVKHLKI